MDNDGGRAAAMDQGVRMGTAGATAAHHSTLAFHLCGRLPRHVVMVDITSDHTGPDVSFAATAGHLGLIGRQVPVLQQLDPWR